MKRLGLLRHAKSDWNDMSLRDFDRGLNTRGRKGAALMGGQVGPAWDMILASPAQRVRCTLDASGLAIPTTFDERVYLADSTTLADLLRALDDAQDAVLLVGHNPGLHDLVLELISPHTDHSAVTSISAKFPTAAFADLELQIDHWRDLADGCARLVRFARPRDIDSDLGPQRG